MDGLELADEVVPRHRQRVRGLQAGRDRLLHRAAGKELRELRHGRTMALDQMVHNLLDGPDVPGGTDGPRRGRHRIEERLGFAEGVLHRPPEIRGGSLGAFAAQIVEGAELFGSQHGVRPPAAYRLRRR
jgi:hypothetical protein